MHCTSESIASMKSRSRANLINSVTGFKPANLVGTASANGATNLAIFTSVVHLGANPPLIGLVMRPVGEVPRHTYENIHETGVYTINHVAADFAEKAHFTSAKFQRDESEFEKCGLTSEFVDGFAAPFVKESPVKLGLKFVQEIPIELNGTIFMIGEIVHLMVPDDAMTDDGSVDLDLVGGVCVAGLDTYFKTGKLAKYPYARPENLPKF